MKIWCLRWWLRLWLSSYLSRNDLRVLDGRRAARGSQQPAAPSLHLPSVSAKQREIVHIFPELFVPQSTDVSDFLWGFYELAYSYNLGRLFFFFLKLNEGPEIFVSSLSGKDLRPQNLLQVGLKWYCQSVRLIKVFSSFRVVKSMFLSVHGVSVVMQKQLAY